MALNRALNANGIVLYDLSSNYFEGTTYPIAARDYSHDGKPSTLQVNYYGLLIWLPGGRSDT